MSLLQRSLSAGAVIALTALLRAACRGRFPRRMFVVLWVLAVLRLLVPLSLPWAYAPRALISACLSRGDHAANAQTLVDIRRGAHVSKTVNGSDDVVIHENPDGHQALSLSLDNQRMSVYIQPDGSEAGK